MHDHIGFLISKALIIIFIGSWIPNLHAQDDCDLLCQMGIEPISEEEAEQNDPVDESPYLSPNQGYEYPDNKQNNAFTQSGGSELIDQNFIMSLAQTSIDLMLMEMGTSLGEAIDINWGRLSISQNKVSWKNLEISYRESTYDDFTKVFTLKNMECYGYKIGTREVFESQMTLLFNESLMKQQLKQANGCSLVMSLDFVDDPVILFEIADEMDLDFENDRELISLMANSLKSISGTSEMRPLGANDHVISSKIDLGGNIMEFSLTVRGMMSLLTTLLGATNEFYYWLGFSTALEFQQYMDSLSPEELPEAYAAITEQQAEYFVSTMDPEIFIRMMDNFDIRSMGLGITWTNGVYRAANKATNMQLDQALNGIKPFLINVMNKTDFSIMMSSIAGPEMAKAFVNLAYPIYIDALSEARMFVNNPRGMRLSVENRSNINLMDLLESTEMATSTEFIRLLSGVKVKIEANPRL